MRQYKHTNVFDELEDDVMLQSIERLEQIEQEYFNQDWFATIFEAPMKTEVKVKRTIE